MNGQMKTTLQRGARHRRGCSRDRGIALATTLILLALLGAASLAITLLVSSDTLINGYYRNYRGSFYAADSGVNVIVESMKNAIQAAGNAAANPPLPATNPQNLASIVASYSGYQTHFYSVGDTGSWRANFEMTNANPLGAPTAPAGQATPCVTNPKDGSATCDYLFPFKVQVKGTSSGTEAEQIVETGVIRYHSYTGGGSGVTPSFAKWGAFIDKFSDCQGSLVPGNMTGPFFTDGQWNFGNYSNPGYTFSDSVGEAGAVASWIKNNNCTDSATVPNGFTSPKFNGGFSVNQAVVQPPANSYNQAQAVLDGKGTPPCTAAPCSPDPAPSQATMNSELKTVNGTAYPSSGSAPTGVYVPWYTTSGGQKMFGAPGGGDAGGFYIEGGASITMSATTDGATPANLTQTYTITQGSTTTTIVVDPGANTTTVTSGSTNQVLTGIPQQLDPNTGAVVQNTDPSGVNCSPTLVYVDGAITGLSGTVQNDMGITITSSSNINITGDITYASSPVSIPSDSLNTSTNAGVLGIYTNGNINLNPDSSGNLTVDASLAAIGSGSSGFCTTGGSISSCNPNSGNDNINTWTIVGGRSEDQAHGVNISQGNTYYDQRFKSGAFGPPWFPTAVLQPGTTVTPPTEATTVARTSWQEVSR